MADTIRIIDEGVDKGLVSSLEFVGASVSVEPVAAYGRKVGRVTVSSTGGNPLTDGDKGDIVVASGGTAFTIDTGVVGTSKLGGDITTAGKALLDDANAAAQLTTLGAAAASHTHSEAEVTNLVSDLAAKQPLDATLTALAGLNATAGLVEETAADTFTKRLIGVANATDIPTRADADTRFAAASHSHPESDVTSLVSDLAGKAAASHSHAESEVTNLTADLAAKQPLDTTLTALAALAVTAGVVEQTSADVFTVRAIGTNSTDLLTRAAADTLYASIFQPATDYTQGAGFIPLPQPSIGG